jgi:hypothetical protein
MSPSPRVRRSPPPYRSLANRARPFVAAPYSNAPRVWRTPPASGTFKTRGVSRLASVSHPARCSAVPFKSIVPRPGDGTLTGSIISSVSAPARTMERRPSLGLQYEMEISMNESEFANGSMDGAFGFKLLGALFFFTFFSSYFYFPLTLKLALARSIFAALFLFLIYRINWFMFKRHAYAQCALISLFHARDLDLVGYYIIIISISLLFTFTNYIIFIIYKYR